MKNLLIFILLAVTFLSFLSAAGNTIAGNIDRIWASLGVLTICIFILLNGHPHDDHPQ